MEYRERIQAKVGILFQIADQYLSGQIPLDKAKELLSCEMVHVRPAQFEAMKVELGERLNKFGSQPESEKLFELFKNYISPPFNKLQTGHPLRSYFEENNSVRSLLLSIDKMEDEEVACEEWKEIYELLSTYRVHINRQEKNFYPRLVPMGMHMKVEKAKEYGKTIKEEIGNNLERLKEGNLIDFLFNQRSLSQILMNYLDLEERVLYPNTLIRFSDWDFVGLRSADDNEGYVFIEQPEEFVPREKQHSYAGMDENHIQTEEARKKPQKYKTELGLVFPAILAAKNMGIVYYTLSGQVVTVMGNQIAELDLQIPEGTIRGLLEGSESQTKYWYKEGTQTYLVTYSIVTDSLGKSQGLLKTKESISELKEFTDEYLERQKEAKGSITEVDHRKENRVIDSTQNIAQLFSMYPKFQEDFYSLDEELKGLKGLKGFFGMDLLKDSTVGMIAKSLRMDTADMVKQINTLLESY